MNQYILHIFTLQKCYRDFKIINFISTFNAKNKAIIKVSRRVVCPKTVMYIRKPKDTLKLDTILIHFKPSFTLQN